MSILFKRTYQCCATFVCLSFLEPPGGRRLCCSFFCDNALATCRFRHFLSVWMRWHVSLKTKKKQKKKSQVSLFHHQEEEDSLSRLPSLCCNQNVTPTLHHRHRRLDLHSLLFSSARSSFNNCCFIYFGTWVQLRA